MGKVLPFNRIRKEVEAEEAPEVEIDDFESYIGSILGDCSLTIANRYWIMENLLMDIDEQLAEYRKSLDVAERILEMQVQAAEREIAAAYLEFNEQVDSMTRAVKKFTISSLRRNAAKFSLMETDGKDGSDRK